MRKPDPTTPHARERLRLLYRAAPAGRWTAPRLARGPAPLYTEQPDGRRVEVASFRDENAARLAAAMHEAVPRLFARIDELKMLTGRIPIVGTIG